MNTKEILSKTFNEAILYLNTIREHPPNLEFKKKETIKLPEKGASFDEVLTLFKEHYGSAISATSGPRYFGYVIGGATPAAIAGDWLTSAYDMISPAAAVTDIHEKDTLKLLLELFDLPQEFSGSFVSGATMSNMVNIGTARQWYGLQLGIDIAKEGLFNIPNFNIFSANAHSSSYKALSMLGIGRNSLTQINQLPNREAIDISQLKIELDKLKGKPSIVIASAGTVNTTDFDDFSSLAELKKDYNFWLHIDGAFGGFAACSPQFKHLVKDWEFADSITIDAHKWMNVPYDSAFQFTKHLNLQQQVFQNSNAAYIKGLGDFSFINTTPQGSRRWRSLSSWFSLMNLGKKGYQDIIEKNCSQAKAFGEFLENSKYFDLMAEVNLNSFCFKLSSKTNMKTEGFLNQLNSSRKVYLTPTNYKGHFCIRGAICNWMTTDGDIEILIQEIKTIINKNI